MYGMIQFFFFKNTQNGKEKNWLTVSSFKKITSAWWYLFRPLRLT